MRLVQKDYYTIEELLERWEMSRRDFDYLIENGHLRLSIRMFGAFLERGDYEQDPETGWHMVPTDRRRSSGLFDLMERDVHTLLQAGEVLVEYFDVEGDCYCRLSDPSKPVLVRTEDLLVRNEERLRAEKWMLAAASEKAPQGPQALSEDNDYQSVSYNGLAYQFGPIQAGIVSILHRAALEGGSWCSGKSLLTEAGSNSPRMADVFKSQPHWRKLIRSDRRGRYRLADPGEG